MIDCLNILKKYYPKGSDAYNLLVAHSKQVADLALSLTDKNPQLNIDRSFTYEAAMLHDIGIFMTHAPSIHCHGDKPYICHGYLGRELLDNLGMRRHALVCERHTGSGLSAQDIIDQDLPLPHRDMLPMSIEEKLVCYADKFFSKSHITVAKPIEKVREEMAKFGASSLARFNKLASLFGNS